MNTRVPQLADRAEGATGGTLAVRRGQSRVRARTVATIGAGLALLGAGLAVWARPAPMPGRSFDGPPPPATPEEDAAAAGVAADVEALAVTIGERHERRYGALLAARDHVEARLRALDLAPRRHRYEVARLPFDNVIADVGPVASGYVLVGAHYDSARGSPGGNDNASGVAALLAIAARLAADPPARGVRLVFFVNEEPPYFGTDDMGSRRLAADLAARGELPAAAVVLDSVGFYTEAPHSQRFASPGQGWGVPDVGRYAVLLGDDLSEAWLREVLGRFRAAARLPSEALLVSRSDFAAGWSDHASFWAHGVPAILVTDTAAFRDARYHTARDDGAQVDPLRVARLALALAAAL